MSGDDTAPQMLYLIDRNSVVSEVAGLLDVSESTEGLIQAAAEHATGDVREHISRLVALLRAGFFCHVGTLSLETIERFHAAPLTLVILDLAHTPARERRLADAVARHAASRNVPVVMLTSDAFNVVDGPVKLAWPLPKSSEALSLLMSTVTS